MTEIISLHIGGSGIRAAGDFWSELNRSRMIDSRGNYTGNNESFDLEMSQVFHRMDKKKRFVPRAILADLDRIYMEDSMEKMFPEDNFVSGSFGSNNCAKAYKDDGPRIMDNLLNTIRKESEKCDFLQGFNLIHSLGEGTGSGLGSLLLESLSDEYPDLILNTFTVFPSRKVSDEGYQWGNSVFGLNALMDMASMVISVDTDSLVDKLQAIYSQMDLLTEEELRNPLTRLLVGTTASLHLPGTESNSQRKMALRHVPFPTMHFVMPDVYPIFSENIHQSDLVKGIFDSKHTSFTSEKLFSAATTFFGVRDHEQLVQDIRKTKSTLAKISRNNFIEPVRLCRAEHSACSLANNSFITQVFSRLVKEFRSAFKKPTFVSWYSSEGMEPADFEVIAHKIEDLSKLYNYKRNSSKIDLAMSGKTRGQIKQYRDFQLVK